jgi:hypothetical protein
VRKTRTSEEEGLEKKRKELNAKSATLMPERRKLEERVLELESASADVCVNDEDGNKFLLNHDFVSVEDAPPSAEGASHAQQRVAGPTHGSFNAFKYGKTQRLSLNKLNPNRNNWVDTPAIDPKDKRFVLPRKHDYYAGWLDAMHALDHKKVIGMEKELNKNDTRSLRTTSATRATPRTHSTQA